MPDDDVDPTWPAPKPKAAGSETVDPSWLPPTPKPVVPAGDYNPAALTFAPASVHGADNFDREALQRTPGLQRKWWIVAAAAATLLAVIGVAAVTIGRSGRSTVTQEKTVTVMPDPPVPDRATPGPRERAEAPPPNMTGPCGPDVGTALREGLSMLSPEPMTGLDWSSTPVESNYDPCANLSTILVTVEGATGSSPMHALMFHRGAYLGTGTLQPFAFTSIDTAASTSDTVVLAYRTGQSCTSCNDGIVTTVRYRWDGTAVQMLDPPPPSQ